MKKVLKDKIINIDNKSNNNAFIFDYLNIDYKLETSWVEVIYISDLLELKKNNDILDKVKNKPSMYSNVYSPQDELEIFKNLFENSIKNNIKIHIIWITLKEELEILEKYYIELWFLRTDVNCFTPNFKIPLVTVSVKIENLMWKWSDYKSLWNKIFFNPPIRESWQVKSMFKWINRWLIAWVYISNFDEKIKFFFKKKIKEKNILAITLAKILNYNLIQIGFKWKQEEFILEY